jgi:hypothetical protein
MRLLRQQKIFKHNFYHCGIKILTAEAQSTQSVFLWITLKPLRLEAAQGGMHALALKLGLNNSELIS